MISRVKYMHGYAMRLEKPVNPSNPYDVPDWREADAYPNEHELTTSQWRWEFVRRSDSYRTQYNLSHQILLKQGYACEEEPFYWLGESFRLIAWIDPRIPAADIDPSDLNYDTDFVFWAALSPDYYDFDKILGIGAHTPLGIPEEDASRRNISLSDFVENNEGCGLFAINPFAPLKPQLAAIERLVAKHLELMAPVLGERPTAPRKHRGKYTDYLRILDARDQSAKDSKASWNIIQKALEKERYGVKPRSLHTQACNTQKSMLRTAVVK